PDGHSIAFERDTAGKHRQAIYLVSARSGPARLFTPSFAWSFGPAWSPTGRMIAFSASRDGKTSGLYVADANGRLLRLLAIGRNEPPNLDTPTDAIWSPDGAQLAFVQGAAIYVVPARGRAERFLAPRTHPAR